MDATAGKWVGYFQPADVVYPLVGVVFPENILLDVPQLVGAVVFPPVEGRPPVELGVEISATYQLGKYHRDGCYRYHHKYLQGFWQFRRGELNNYERVVTILARTGPKL